MSVAFLDCREEVSELRETPPGRLAWLSGDLNVDDWFLQMGPDLLDEISRLIDYIQEHPLQNLQRKVTDLRLPRCEETTTKMKSILDHGVGFAVLDRLPIESAPIEVMIEVFWLLGQLIGRPVAQKWNGEMIYDVRDTGEEYGYGVRGSHTSVELVFHTDNAFARMVPDYVGLFCRRPALEGGVSRFCSLYTVHDRMLRTFPDALRRLYQPMLFDRQKEHHEGAPPVCFAPYFSWYGDRLNARANSQLVRKGYEVAGQAMDNALADALDAIDEVCASGDLWFEAPLQAGQIQYLNNHEVGHYRSAFTDGVKPDEKRHLYRLWHRERGSVCYDGESFDS